jgi:WD40 repeat protein
MRWRALAGHHAEVNNLAFSSDGKSLVSTDDDTNVILWRLGDSPEICRTFKPALDYPPDADEILDITGVAFGQNDQTLAFASDDTVTLWDLNSGSTIGSLEINTDADLKNVAFSPDGTKIALGGDKSLFVFNADVKLWVQAARAIANRHMSEEEQQFYSLKQKSECVSH